MKIFAKTEIIKLTKLRYLKNIPIIFNCFSNYSPFIYFFFVKNVPPSLSRKKISYFRLDFDDDAGDDSPEFYISMSQKYLFPPIIFLTTTHHKEYFV